MENDNKKYFVTKTRELVRQSAAMIGKEETCRGLRRYLQSFQPDETGWNASVGVSSGTPILRNHAAARRLFDWGWVEHH